MNMYNVVNTHWKRGHSTSFVSDLRTTSFRFLSASISFTDYRDKLRSFSTSVMLKRKENMVHENINVYYYLLFNPSL